MNLKRDYSYDISVEDLKRYSKLKPREILRWLEEYQKFIRAAKSVRLRRPANRF